MRMAVIKLVVATAALFAAICFSGCAIVRRTRKERLGCRFVPCRLRAVYAEKSRLYANKSKMICIILKTIELN